MFTFRWNGWMNSGYLRTHAGLYVSMVLCGTGKYLKKIINNFNFGR